MINDAINSVLYNIDQREDTSAADKKTARDNIGAVSADDVGEIVGNFKPLQVPVEITYPDYAILKKLTQNTNGVVGIECSYIHCATQSDNGLMSATDKTKLDGIQAGAEVNVQSDWSQSDSTADDFIKNKPTIPGVTTTTEGPDETYVVPVNTLDFNIDNLKVKADSTVLGTLAPVMTPTEQRVLTLDANDPVPYWAIPSTGGNVFIATYGTTTYSEITNALAANKAVILRYGGADIPISSSTASRHAFLQVRREAHSYAQQADSTRVFIVNSDDTWEMNSVPVAYNILAGGGLTYAINGNDMTLSVSASFMPDLNLLTNNTVNVNSNTTLDIAAGNAYNIKITGSASPIITLSTTSITTIHSFITVKNESASSCSDITIRFNDETGYQHDIQLALYESAAEYDFYVDIRKVSSTVIARVYDLPCMFRQGWMGSAQYQNDTAWIGYVR